MTENKRFTSQRTEDYNFADILDNKNKTWIGLCHIDSADDFCEALNELSDENEQLKKQVEIYKGDGLETLGDLQRAEENNRKVLNNIEQLEKENEQLKQTVNTICKDYENHYGMDIRNADWFTAW